VDCAFLRVSQFFSDELKDYQIKALLLSWRRNCVVKTFFGRSLQPKLLDAITINAEKD
jgi:hypothetical protein